MKQSKSVSVGITTPSCPSISNTTNKIPIVLGAVTSPKNSGLVKNEKHPEKNIMGYRCAASN